MSVARTVLRFVLCALLTTLVTVIATAAAADPRPAPAEPPPPEPETAPDSPRAALRQYVELCRAGEFDEAAQFLDLPAKRAADGAALARKLKTVLDRHLWIDAAIPKLASPLSGGNANDRLPPGVDELGTVPGPKGPDPVRIVKRAQGAPWVFSRTTVERIDVWYARLEERWLFDALPEPLLRPGPFDILYWQYLALPVLVAAAWAMGRVLGFFTRKIIAKAVARTASRWDDALIERIGPPLTLAWGLGVFAFLLPRLGLYEPARDTVQKVIRAGFLIALFWSVLRAIDVARAYALEVVPGRPATRSVVPLGAQIVKVVVLSAAVLTVLSELGYPVTSLIAGLGIGGVALALAAQKTVENLFGSLSIGVDQPFKVGDLIKVEEVTGTVEEVGLRSTRIRTLDRTLVTIPNGKLADMRIECFAVRDRYRLVTTLGLVYGTTAAQIRQILEAIELALHEEPSLFKDELVIAVKAIGASSVDVEVMAWFELPSLSDFIKLRQEMLLRLLEIVEKNGSALAYPTQTIHFVSGGVSGGGSGPPSPGASPAREARS